MVFNEFARKAAFSECLNQIQVHLSLKLKAQAQCRAPLEALAEIKNPRPVAFVKQANIAHGPQQVNNQSGGNNGAPPEPPAGGIQRRRTNYWSSMMANGWTPERRAKQAEAIRRWKPWTGATGPVTDAGKAASSCNAKHGIYSAQWRDERRRVNELLRECRSLRQRI
jgi:hypothetical protein